MNNIANSSFIDSFGSAIKAQKLNTANLKEKNLAQAEKTAEDFEAFFLGKTFSTMFETVSTEGMFGGGNAEKIYRSLLVDEYGKTMAKNGGIGVAGHVMDTIIKIQEAQNVKEETKGLEEVQSEEI